MKKLFTLIAMALVTMGAWAETKTISPAAEMAFRTAGTEKDVTTEPTAWQSGFPKTDQATIECTYSQRMWAQQMYEVTGIDFENVTKVSLNFTMAAKANYRLGAWIYPDANWTGEAAQTWTDGKCPVVENFKAAIGTYPSFIAESNTWLSRYEGSTSGNTTQNIDFTSEAQLKALKNAVVEKDGKKYINFIITFSEPKASWSKDRAPKFYGMGNETESNRPYMSIEMAEPVKSVDTWSLTDSWKTSKNGAVEVSNGILNITSFSDNAKRGDIKNASETFRLDGNKVIYYEVKCTASDVTTNAGDRKIGFTVTIDGTTYVVEQYMYKGIETLANGNELIYFDLANIEQYGKDKTPVIYITSDAKFDTTQKTEVGNKIKAAASLKFSNVVITLIGTDATDFTISKMGSAKDVATLLNSYGIETGIESVKNANAKSQIEYNLAGMRSVNGKGIVVMNGKKYMK